MNRSERTLNLINEARREDEARLFTTPGPGHRTDVRSEDPAQYEVNKPCAVRPNHAEDEQSATERLKRQAREEDQCVLDAIAILDARLKAPGCLLDNPDDVKAFLRLKTQENTCEVFVVLFLDVKNRLITQEEMFRGTLTATSVYPREVLKAALKHNAASVMLCHNHPSGTPEPSPSDLLLTRDLVQALALVDVRVLDHFIVAGNMCYSFAEHGKI